MDMFLTLNSSLAEPASLIQRKTNPLWDNTAHFIYLP